MEPIETKVAEESSNVVSKERTAENRKKNSEELKEKKRKRALERQRAQEERARREAEASRIPEVVSDEGTFGCYGVLNSNEEQRKLSSRSFVQIADIPEYEGKEVWVRARVHRVKKTGALAFFWLRQNGSNLCQVVIEKKEFGAPFKALTSKVPSESIVDVFGLVRKVDAEIRSLSIRGHEIVVKRFFVVSFAEAMLPLQLEDCSRPQRSTDSEENPIKEEDGKKMAEMPTVGRDMRLDYRWIDLRTPANQAIFRVQALVQRTFRDYLEERGFVEVHTPKLIPCASESGASVFSVPYFGRTAYLAQSPQLYKQMCMNSDFGGVFEIGSVFRAEHADTHRHLSEFMGLDLEMEIKYDYHEFLDLLGKMMVHIFRTVLARRDLVEPIEAQFGVPEFQCPDETVIVEYKDGMKMLREDFVETKKKENPDMNEAETVAKAAEIYNDYGDLDTPSEKRLGALVKAKFGTDFYILDHFPASVRPFYTMPNPVDANSTNSYDVFLRGEEISSGAQRIHDHALLVKQCEKHDPSGALLKSIGKYAESFAAGSPPHAGAGLGLERVVMLLLGLSNIRQTSMFPRDYKRVSP